MLVLAELVIQLARAALFACQARLDDMGLPAQRAPLVGRLLLGASARARCTVRSDCSCAYFTFSCEIVCQYVWASGLLSRVPVWSGQVAQKLASDNPYVMYDGMVNVESLTTRADARNRAHRPRKFMAKPACTRGYVQ